MLLLYIVRRLLHDLGRFRYTSIKFKRHKYNKIEYLW